MQIAAFLFLAFTFVIPGGLAAASSIESVAVDETWVRLLYLTSKEGNSVLPEKELELFLSEMRGPASLGDQHIACRFPARSLWLRRKSPKFFESLHLPACPKFEAWLAQINSDRAYLLFAAQFLNSPASMYGHTLLQLGRSGSTKSEAILDYVVAYGADSGNSGGLSYLWNGLTGGFNGKFSTVPFYLKIREYNDAESRDLWAYQLRLSPEQMELLVRHIWEIRGAEFPYYFLGKNCSYFLLKLLDVVGSGPSLTSELPAWTIPTDTIRVLKTAGWIGERTRRSSRSRRMNARRELLGRTERSLAKELGTKINSIEQVQSAVGSLSPDRAALVLDTAFDLHRYHLGGRVPAQEDQARERALLVSRSQIALPPLELEQDAGEAPEDAHLSNRWSLAAGQNRRGEALPRFFLDMEWRPAIQDLLSNPFALDHYGEQEGWRQTFLRRISILSTF